MREDNDDTGNITPCPRRDMHTPYAATHGHGLTTEDKATQPREGITPASALRTLTDATENVAETYGATVAFRGCTNCKTVTYIHLSIPGINASRKMMGFDVFKFYCRVRTVDIISRLPENTPSPHPIAGGRTGYTPSRSVILFRKGTTGKDTTEPRRVSVCSLPSHRCLPADCVCVLCALPCFGASITPLRPELPSGISTGKRAMEA